MGKERKEKLPIRERECNPMLRSATRNKHGALFIAIALPEQATRL